jgi:hypothetical protein
LSLLQAATTTNASIGMKRVILSNRLLL